MGFRFRKSVNLGGGFRVNFSKSGVGYSWGTKGARITKTAKGKTRTTLTVPGTGLSYVQESGAKHQRTSQVCTSQSSQRSDRTERSLAMKWIDFIICFFLGVFGIHKFREKKIGLGILYLFTCGLFGIGWIYDCAQYFIVAIKVTPMSSIEPADYVMKSEAAEPFAMDNLAKQSNALLEICKKHWRWILIVVLAIILLVSFPSFSALCALLGIGAIIPIPKWQAILEKWIKGKYKSIAAIGLAVLTFFSFPSAPERNSGNSQETTMPIVAEETEPVHIHNFADATCLLPGTCVDCGEARGEALGHMWKTSTCLELKTCSVCQATEGELADHNWESATCLVPKTCSVCQKTEGELADHSWVAATCLAPQTCSVCQITEGELADHSWTEATCLAPKTCSVCEITKGDLAKHSWEDATCLAPKTCSVCKETKGELGSHKWEKATCIAPKTCSVCGEKDGYATDCKYKNGICVYCEDAEPTVWIPRTGSRYHSRSSCSNMDNPSEVPISKAISRGFTPCKRCH